MQLIDFIKATITRKYSVGKFVTAMHVYI